MNLEKLLEKKTLFFQIKNSKSLFGKKSLVFYFSNILSIDFCCHLKIDNYDNKKCFQRIFRIINCYIKTIMWRC